MFCSFKQDIDSLLNCEEGRQTLRDVGIKTPPEVGDWLVETLKETFGQDELANQLHQVLHPFESPVCAKEALCVSCSYNHECVLLKSEYDICKLLSAVCMCVGLPQTQHICSILLYLKWLWVTLAKYAS